MPPKSRNSKHLRTSPIIRSLLPSSGGLDGEKSRTTLEPAVDEYSIDSIDSLITAATSKDGLARLIQDLTKNSKLSLFEEYKCQVLAQLESDQALIQEMSAQLANQELKIKSLQRDLSVAKNDALAPAYDSPIRNNIRGTSSSNSSTVNKGIRGDSLNASDPVAREFENIGFSLDMLELLTGLRICNFDEDEHKFYFEIHQNSNAKSYCTHVDYVLVISKSFDKVAEVCYVPTFLESLQDGSVDDVKNARYLRDTLPEYLCANLTFPYDTLPQFYVKMTRAINRRQ